MRRTLYISPAASLFIVLAAAFFSPLIEGGTTHLPVFLLKLLVIAASAGAVYSMYNLPSPRIYRTGYEYPLLLLILAVAVSSFIAPNKYMAMVWVQLIVFYVLFLYVATWTFREVKGAEVVTAYAVIAMGAVQAGVGIYQYTGGDVRVNGTFFNPNMMAGYVSACVCMALSLGLSGGGRKGRGVVRSAFLFGYAISCTCAVILSGSRGGVLALAAGAAVVLWFRFRYFAFAAAGLILVAVTVIPNPVRHRILHPEEGSLAYKRVAIWKSAVERIEDHPLGVGLGNFKYYSDVYAIPVEESVSRYGTTARTAHNEYLHFAAEAGVLGVMAMAYLLYTLFVQLHRTIRRNRGRPVLPVLVGAAAGITALLTHSLVDSNLHEPGIVFMFLTFVALCSASSGEDAGVVEVPHKAKGRLIAVGSAALVLLGLWAAPLYLAHVYENKSFQASKEGSLYTALEYADKAVYYQPHNPDYVSNKAAVCFKQFLVEKTPSLFDKTLELLKEAERLNSANGKYPSLRSYVLLEGAKMAKDPPIGKVMLQEALAASGRAVKLAPYRADYGYNRAAILVRLERLEEAENELEKVVSYEPNHMKSRLLLAKIYRATGRNELSPDTARSIINDYERLTAGPLDELGRSFISVDIDEANSLAGPVQR